MSLTPTNYEKHKDVARRWMAGESQRGRNIGDIPDVANPRRRKEAAASLRRHCEIYHAQTFDLAWSDDHLAAIARIEDSVFRGGLFAYAMPRGQGKTSLCEVGAEWAQLNGHRPFVALIGSDEGHAADMLASIKMELETNELLGCDYPEACAPIAKLEGIAQRANGQLYKDERTHIEWTASEVVLPTLKPEGWLKKKGHKAFVRPDGYSLSSGAIIKVAGITGGIRGMKHKRADGKTVRPSLVILDDPQTDGSARSPSQCETRERILAGAVLGLAGPGKKIAGIMPCTVIAPGDMADNILNREKHPAWHGTRTKMVYVFPVNEKPWDQYAQLRREGLKAGDGGKAATEFYAANREAMDEGVRVSWPARFNHDELSAIQHAMNLKIDNERAFWSEYQNEPLPEDDSRPDALTPDQIAGKLSNLPRGLVPLACHHVTAMIDVHENVLYYTVAAWEDGFTGYILDYGTFPDQKAPYFSHKDAKVTLASLFPKAGKEGRIYAGLEAVVDLLLGRELKREDNTVSTIGKCLIDAGYATETVLKFCRQSKHAALLTPSKGMGLGPANKPFLEYQKRPGDRVGHHWRIPTTQGRAVRQAIVDANYWKTFVQHGLGTSMGDKGCISLFGSNPATHRMYADHLTAERHDLQFSKTYGRWVDVWTPKPGHPDNHYLDTVVGCAVGASMLGVATIEGKADLTTGRKKYGAGYFQGRRQAQA